jgi:hypothetical protein
MERIKELVSKGCTYRELLKVLTEMHGNTEFAGTFPEFAGRTIGSNGARSLYRTASGTLVVVTEYDPSPCDAVLAVESPGGEVVERLVCDRYSEILEG